MKKNNLTYSDYLFIQNALIYYCIHEAKIMETVYSDEEISKFRSSVQELNNKIEKIKEGE